MKNRMLILWDGGYVVASDAASVTANGVHEGFLSAAGIPDVDIVDQLAAQNLATTSTPDESLVAQMDDTSATSGYSTFVDFGVGDSVTAPARGGGTQTVRCVGITLAEDGDAYLDVVTEWDTVRDVAEDRLQRWLSRTENGTLDGRSPTPVVSVSSPSIVSSGVVNSATIDMSTDGGYAPEVGDKSAGHLPRTRGFLWRATIKATAAGIADTTVRVKVNGSDLFAITLPASSVSAVYDLSYGQLTLVERTDIVAFDVTAAGGAEGISVQCLITPVEP